MVDVYLSKKYKLTSSENFEAYLKALGVGFVARKLVNSLSPVLELTKEGDEYTLWTITSVKTEEVKFKSGVEFEHETTDGRHVKVTITIIDGATLHEVQRDIKTGEENIIDRTFTQNEVKAIMTYKNVTATRIYKIEA